ncbi:MAG: LamG domain-containing protein [Flavisolibacter sp.]
MKLNTNKLHQALALLFMGLAFAACQKMERPALGDYPKDANPPGGPVKFYAAMNGGSVDSIRATYATDNNVSYVAGVNGKAAKFDVAKKGFIVYPSANDFGAQTNFSVSLWINAGTTADKDHVNADGILEFGKSSDFWGNFTLFADHETSTSDSMRLTLVLAGNFITHDNQNRIPHMYDGKWHHLVFTYDAASSLYTFYLDGAKYEQKTVANVKFKDPSVLVVGGFQQAASIQGTYEANTWMSAFPGLIDQVRLYGTVLTQADVTNLYNNKL